MILLNFEKCTVFTNWKYHSFSNYFNLLRFSSWVKILLLKRLQLFLFQFREILSCATIIRKVFDLILQSWVNFMYKQYFHSVIYIKMHLKNLSSPRFMPIKTYYSCSIISKNFLIVCAFVCKALNVYFSEMNKFSFCAVICFPVTTTSPENIVVNNLLKAFYICNCFISFV